MYKIISYIIGYFILLKEVFGFWNRLYLFELLVYGNFKII